MTGAPALPPAPWTNAEQSDQEAAAARIFALPEIRRAVQALERVAMPAPQMRLASGTLTWRRSMEELAFAFVIRAVNADPLRPRILWDQTPPHMRDGVWIPGSRCTGNNPDNIYRRVPLDPSSRYRLQGWVIGEPAGDVTLSILPDLAAQESWGQTTCTLEELRIDPGGRFSVLLDSEEPRGERGNHICLRPGAARMTIRESMTDWDVQSPMRFAIEQLAGPPSAREVNEASMARELAERLPRFARHWIDFSNRTYFSGAPNEFAPLGTPPGGLATQLSAMGNFSLREDEALWVRMSTLGARYWGVQLLDPWMFALPYRDRCGSRNPRQSAPGAEGDLDFVISIQDPGVANWLDTDGLSQGAMHVRWQGLPTGARPATAVQAKKVRLDQLHQLGLAVRNDPQRRDELARREIAHDRRFED
jgi:hypothetical protein